MGPFCQQSSMIRNAGLARCKPWTLCALWLHTWSDCHHAMSPLLENKLFLPSELQKAEYIFSKCRGERKDFNFMFWTQMSVSVLLWDGFTTWPEFREERKPGRSPTCPTGTSVTMETIQATMGDLLAAGDGFYLRQPGAKPRSCQTCRQGGVLGPRIGSALLAPAVLGRPGLPRGTALFQCPLCPRMNQDNFMNPVAFPDLNSGILACLSVVVALPGSNAFKAPTAQPQ